MEITGQTREQLDYNYVKSLVQAHSNMAHALGFAWVGGNRNGNNLVGKEMDVWRDQNGNWNIRGNRGACSGYRCHDQTSIYVSKINGSQVGPLTVVGNPKIEDLGIGHVYTIYAMNYSDQPQAFWLRSEVANEVSYTATKTRTMGLENTITSGVTFPLFGAGISGQTSLTTYFEQGSSTSSGTLERRTDAAQCNPIIPPGMAMSCTITLRKANTSYEYKMPVELTANIGYHGFLRWSGNAYHGHPKHRPTVLYNFGNSPTEPSERNLRTQYLNRNVPIHKTWDFNWMVSQYGVKGTEQLLNGVYSPRTANMLGVFRASTSTVGQAVVSKAIPISQVPPEHRKYDLGTKDGIAFAGSHDFRGRFEVSRTKPDSVEQGEKDGVEGGFGTGQQPKSPIFVSIDRVAGDDVLSQGEYRPRYTKITGKHRGADKVVLRYESRYSHRSRTAAVYKNGTWAVWLNDDDLRAMQTGTERLTVTATRRHRLGADTKTATRNIRVDAIPEMMVSIDRVAGDDVISGSEYKPHHLRISGKYSGAPGDRVFLRFNNGRDFTVAQNPTGGWWQFYPSDTEMKIMGKGAASVTVAVKRGNVAVVAQRKVRVASDVKLPSDPKW